MTAKRKNGARADAGARQADHCLRAAPPGKPKKVKIEGAAKSRKQASPAPPKLKRTKFATGCEIQSVTPKWLVNAVCGAVRDAMRQRRGRARRDAGSF